MKLDLGKERGEKMYFKKDPVYKKDVTLFMGLGSFAKQQINSLEIKNLVNQNAASLRQKTRNGFLWITHGGRCTWGDAPR